MKRINVRDLPIAENVCEQVLREVEKQPAWSLAHVTMNPLAAPLLHRHQRLGEIYVVTKGYGELGTLLPQSAGSWRPVAPGSVCGIPAGVAHQLRNKSLSHLEHLVISWPPFDPADVQVLTGQSLAEAVQPFWLPTPEDCFDGAKIVSYKPDPFDLSVAFGSVLNNPVRHKRPHYHEKTTEFVYVVSGRGFIWIEGKLLMLIFFFFLFLFKKI